MGQIQGDQIVDGTITDADISSSAAIQTSKLANGADFLKRNGSVIMTADLNLNTHNINDLAAATDANQAVPKNQMDTAIATVSSSVTTLQGLSVLISNLIFNEVPSGTVNGTNAAFTLANTPVSGKVLVFRNGNLQTVGAGKEVTISGSTITFAVAPATGSEIVAIYVKA